MMTPRYLVDTDDTAPFPTPVAGNGPRSAVFVNHNLANQLQECDHSPGF